jgi:hypothetical protein
MVKQEERLKSSRHHSVSQAQKIPSAMELEGNLEGNATIIRLERPFRDCNNSNLAITQEEMRQVHLGKRLDDSVLYSRQTMNSMRKPPSAHSGT